MARKHNRKGIKSPVEQILVTPGVVEKKILLNPHMNEYEVTHIPTPDVVKQGRALHSTLEKGRRNTGGIDNPKPKKEAK